MIQIITKLKLYSILSLFSVLALSCEGEKKEKAIPIPEIKVVKVIQKETPIYKEFVGQMYGLKDIPIRARVQGFLEGIFFDEGRAVKKGQLLYTIDPQPFMAEVASKESALAEVKTLLVNAENELARYKPLAEINAVSKSDLDAAQSTRDAAVSSVDAARADLRLAEINLGYTKIQAPIYGVIGKTEAREGEFVGKDPNPVILNTVSRIDTMRVQFFLTEREYLLITREVLQRSEEQHLIDSLADENAYQRARAYNLDLLLSDGSTYPFKGSVDFINRNIDPKTGSMLVQAHFPNPRRLLRPGLYAKVRAKMQVIEDALLVPQRCVNELQGQYSVYVVNDDNSIVAKQISVGKRIDDLWLITDGLEGNELIVIDGLQKVASGMKVNPTVIEFKSQFKTNN
jgi:membrane fusion protein (multidrug efflux system)